MTSSFATALAECERALHACEELQHQLFEEYFTPVPPTMPTPPGSSEDVTIPPPLQFPPPPRMPSLPAYATPTSADGLAAVGASGARRRGEWGSRKRPARVAEKQL
jgi:hypothetical protein